MLLVIKTLMMITMMLKKWLALEKQVVRKTSLGSRSRTVQVVQHEYQTTSLFVNVLFEFDIKNSVK